MAEHIHQQHILVVEDDQFLRKILTDKLTSAGYKTSAVLLGEDGLQEMQKWKPDLVILDLLLPQMDGFAVLEKMKADEHLRDIPVIILSNFGQQQDIDKGLAMGAAMYLIKINVSPHEIIDKVRSVLDGAKNT